VAGTVASEAFKEWCARTINLGPKGWTPVGGAAPPDPVYGKEMVYAAAVAFNAEVDTINKRAKGRPTMKVQHVAYVCANVRERHLQLWGSPHTSHNSTNLPPPSTCRHTA
jgi:hypothetical protein